MDLRWPFLFLLLALNGFAYAVLRQSILVFVRPEARRRAALRWLAVLVVVLNLPLCTFFVVRLGDALLKVPTSVLAVVFYPSTAWLATLLAFGILAGPIFLIAAAIPWLRRRGHKTAGHPSSAGLSRRQILGGSAGLLIPPVYAAACYGSYGNLDELEISPERRMVVPNLPRSLDGMTIAQVSDLHVGAYIREQELRFLASRVNALRPDLIAITGDILDVSLKSLPDAVRGLSALQAPLGIFAVLGNHDIYADRYSFNRLHRGGVRVAQGIEKAGVRTLRNEVAYLGEGTDRLALLGLDWLSPSPNEISFSQYREKETIQQLSRMSAQVEPETPKVLLAHHPDTFQDTGPFQIALTLAGHTHGGGQIILGHIGGVPLGVGIFRFKYLSGLYQRNGASLYVNRGIGYLGIPIRINCPPEISVFRLVRSAEEKNSKFLSSRS